MSNPAFSQVGILSFVFAIHSQVARQPQNIGFPIHSRRLDIIK